MKRSPALWFAVLMLPACAPVTPPPAYVPPLLICEARCKQECDKTAPKWAPPDANAPGAWDLIRPQVVDPLVAKLEVCDEHRRACVACIEEADRQGIVISQEP